MGSTQDSYLTRRLQLKSGIKKPGPGEGTHRFLGFLRPLRGGTHRRHFRDRFAGPTKALGSPGLFHRF